MKTHPDSLAGIQILRGVAAILVVFHHTLEESLFSRTPPISPDWLTTFGASGVDIFFVISGFIMIYVSFPPDRRPSGPISFLFRRFLRIYPFYWFCAAAVLLLWTIGFFQSLRPDGRLIARSFLLLPSDRMVLGVAWTLVYEMYFYMIFAATLFFQSAFISLMLTAAVISALLLVSGLVPDPELGVFISNPIAIEFCFGLLLGYLFRRKSHRWTAAGYLGILGVACLIAAPVFVPHDSTNGLPGVMRPLVWGLPAMIIVASFLRIDSSDSFAMRTGVILGDSSYAVYLTHPFVMIAYAKLMRMSPEFSHQPQLLFAPIVMGLCVLVGVVAHLFIEKRVMASARALSHKAVALIARPERAAWESKRG